LKIIPKKKFPIKVTKQFGLKELSFQIIEGDNLFCLEGWSNSSR